jgi:RimJ/RimL family protein N-acetyltransferase
VVIFSEFIPTEDKLKILAQKLMEDHLYLSDEFRDYEFIHKMLFTGFSNENNIFYEIGSFDGLIGFANIIPGFKCEIVFKLWNPKLWGFRFKTQFKQLIKTIMGEYNLKRMAGESPDEKMVRLARICGFKTEGRFKHGFSWDKKTYTLHKMRILREDIKWVEL